MGVLKQNLRSPLPCLPRQGEGIKSALSLNFFTSACANNSQRSHSPDTLVRVLRKDSLENFQSGF